MGKAVDTVHVGRLGLTAWHPGSASNWTGPGTDPAAPRGGSCPPVHPGGPSDLSHRRSGLTTRLNARQGGCGAGRSLLSGSCRGKRGAGSNLAPFGKGPWGLRGPGPQAEHCWRPGVNLSPVGPQRWAFAGGTEPCAEGPRKESGPSADCGDPGLPLWGGPARASGEASEGPLAVGTVASWRPLPPQPGKSGEEEDTTETTSPEPPRPPPPRAQGLGETAVSGGLLRSTGCLLL